MCKKRNKEKGTVKRVVKNSNVCPLCKGLDKERCLNCRNQSEI
jgi:hypothetical protein